MTYWLKFVLINICLPLIFVFGLAGNLTVLVVFSRRNIRNMPSNCFLRTLAIHDVLALSSIVIWFFTSADTHASSIGTCKLLTIIGFFLSSIASWILSITSVHRLVLIKYQHMTVIFHRVWFKAFIVGLIYVANLGFYSVFSFHGDLIVNNLTNDAMCGIADPAVVRTFNMLNFVLTTLLPWLIMSASSCLIIQSIYSTRKRVMVNKAVCELKRLKKDVQFSVIIIAMNVLFFVFNAPIFVYNLLLGAVLGNGNDLLKLLFNVLYYGQYIFNILVYIFLNKLFKKELASILNSCL